MYKVRGIRVGTERDLVLDSEVYNLIISGPHTWDQEFVVGKYFVAWIKNTETGLRSFAHDFVMELHGLKKGIDYDYVEFTDSFNSTITSADYDSREILFPPMGIKTTLDCRLENLAPIKKADLNQEITSQYQGVKWDEERKKWRSYLNASQSKIDNTQYISHSHLEIVAARQHDLACVENGISDTCLNFARSDYLQPDGCPISMDSIVSIRCRNNKTSFGFEAAVFDDTRFKTPKLVLEKFYKTQEDAQTACERYVKGKFGPLSEAFFPAPTVITSEKFQAFCQKCSKLIPLGAGNFLVPSPSGIQKVCESCFSVEEVNDSDMPSPVKLLEPGPIVESFKICKVCGRGKPKTIENFPTYKYKGEIRFNNDCRECRSLKDKERYRDKKNETLR